MSGIPHSGRITLDPLTIDSLMTAGRNIGHETPADRYSPGGWIDRLALVRLIRAVEDNRVWRESVAVEIEDAERALERVGWQRADWPPSD